MTALTKRAEVIFGEDYINNFIPWFIGMSEGIDEPVELAEEILSYFAVGVDKMREDYEIELNNNK